MNAPTHIMYACLAVSCLGNVYHLHAQEAAPLMTSASSSWWQFMWSYLSVLLVFVAYADHILLGRKLVQEVPSEEDKRHHLIAASVMELACLYDPVQSNGALERFRTVQRNSRCMFAKAAVIWGCDEWRRDLSLEDNVKASMPTLQQCLLRGEHEGLDGFLFEIRGQEYFKTVDVFGQTVRRVLTAIADNDLKKYNCMRTTVNRKGWYFSFNSEPIFVTTFAPLYDKHSSRYMHLDKNLPAIKFAHSPGKVCAQSDDDYDSCFVLLQPEYSFLMHELESDTPETNWEEPKTIRDRIRCAFKSVGQQYEIPSTTDYPPALHIVKPLNWRSDPAVEWWEEKKGSEENPKSPCR
jgi:hypothetical protein